MTQLQPATCRIVIRVEPIEDGIYEVKTRISDVETGEIAGRTGGMYTTTDRDFIAGHAAKQAREHAEALGFDEVKDLKTIFKGVDE
ncbi:hypothetical protein [Salibacterium sp. K-3]